MSEQQFTDFVMGIGLGAVVMMIAGLIVLGVYLLK